MDRAPLSHGLTQSMRKRMIRGVERLIVRLTDRQVLKEPSSAMGESDLFSLCQLLPEVLLNESACLELSLDRPIYVVGDFRGQYAHMIHMFNAYGHPPETRYLFLGNYADDNDKGLEVVALLLSYKLLYPKSFFLLRGRHECDLIGRLYGVFDVCVKRFSRRLWHELITVFSYLPICALIDEQVFCVHGGLSPLFEFSRIANVDELKSQIRQLVPRPAIIERNSIHTHLLWSDPDETTDCWEQNPIGMGYLFGPAVVAKFCNQLGIRQIIRSGEMVPDGYAFFKDPRLLTIFSAPDLASQYANDGATVYLSRPAEEIRGRIKIMKPIIQLRCKQTTRVNVLFEEFIFHLARQEQVI